VPPSDKPTSRERAQIPGFAAEFEPRPLDAAANRGRAARPPPLGGGDQEMARFFMKKALATAVAYNDIAAVRHDLPHMPSLGVSSLDSRPPWRHGGLLFCQLLCGWLTMAKFQRKAGQGSAKEKTSEYGRAPSGRAFLSRHRRPGAVPRLVLRDASRYCSNSITFRPRAFDRHRESLAEGVRFELTVDLRPRRFSRPLP
jgi:hypothetical protein